MYLPPYIRDIHGTVFPPAPVERELFYRDDLHVWFQWNGAGWVNLHNPAIIEHGNEWHNPDFATEADLVAEAAARDAADAAEAAARIAADAAHAALTALGIHGSAVLATPNTLIHRDAAGRAKIANPAVAADIDNLGSRAAAIAAHATLANAHHAEDHSGRHETGGADILSITHDLAETYMLPYLLYRLLIRYMYLQFDSYDMITEQTGGTGYTGKTFFNPVVRPGAVSGGNSQLYQNEAWMYVDRDSLFIQAGSLSHSDRDCVAFLGIADKADHVITLGDTTKHAGFIFKIDGATNTVYISVGDGVDFDDDDISEAANDFAVWAMICDVGGITFYRDWVQVGSRLTSYIPADKMVWKMSMVSSENADAALSGRAVLYAQHT